MSYIDGFVIPVPSDRKDAFIAHARQDIPALLRVAEAAARFGTRHVEEECAAAKRWTFFRR